jgi:glycosyltransferase involved in cell wall biosynthesis
MNVSIPIMIKVWAGSAAHDLRYIRRSLPSLLRSELPAAARVILINDVSPNPLVAPMLARLATKNSQVEVWTNPKRLGPNGGQAYNFPRVVERFPNAPFYVLCDDDIIYHPGWLQRLIAVYNEARQRGLMGVFAALNIPFRPHYAAVRLPTCEVLLKRRQPALNWLIPREVYEQVGPFRETGVAYDTDYTDRLIAAGLPVICMRPSFVQNIGYVGAYQTDDQLKAPDYVGRRDLYLIGRDLYYEGRRQTYGRLVDWVENLPESRSKRAIVYAGRKVRSVVRQLINSTAAVRSHKSR